MPEMTSFSHFTDLCGGELEIGLGPNVCTESFLDNFSPKMYVKYEKLALFWHACEAKIDQLRRPVNSMDTALCFLYIISTVLILSI